MHDQVAQLPDRSRTIEEVVARTLLIPGRHRDFDVPRAMLAKAYAIDAELLADLLDAGLPHQGGGEELRLNSFDLENVTVELELNCPNWMLMKTLARAFDGELGKDSSSAYAFRTTGRCPEPGHPGECEFAPSAMLDATPGSGEVTWDSPLSFTRRVRLPEEEYWFDDTARALFEPVHRLTFHLLPHELSTDVGFARETGLADCRLASHVLLAETRDAGAEVRGASGLIMAAPFPLQHMWIEVRTADGWTAADPFFLRTLAGWRILDPRVWPEHRSPRRIYWPIDGAPAPEDIVLVTHRGERASSSSRIVNWQPQQP
ncbi:hypothetical protein [Kitasatospora sp. A2-31]|uniref:hypothetical protein n=1 Tax=Kitasatospora sp. A2-31 TaxID=2916414 RepID=UPI001EEC5C3B|nr:hypothetical protein [Kitasatospora sp. A2-31]MCG6495355.1 hypothetical protein [Kitasatospora sp. A2-31]